MLKYNKSKILNGHDCLNILYIMGHYRTRIYVELKKPNVLQSTLFRQYGYTFIYSRGHMDRILHFLHQHNLTAVTKLLVNNIQELVNAHVMADN